MNLDNLLTKTDFLLYLESPMHLWAHKHGKWEEATSEYNQHLMDQGRQVEKLARDFLVQHIGSTHPTAEIHFEKSVIEKTYSARLDAAVYDPDQGVWDIYEIKSGTSIHKENLYDAAFQYLVASANFEVRDSNIIYLNKNYMRDGDIILEELFVLENINSQVQSLCAEIMPSREMAWQVAQSSSPDGVPTCHKPKDCPCPTLCHPNLPAYPIYDLPNIWRKVDNLRAAGITAIEDIPPGYGLSEKQNLYAVAAKQKSPVIDIAGVQALLDEMVYPLYFLDYETFNTAVPWFDGYRPHQHMVFQYSLHVFASLDAEPEHFEYLATEYEDPSLGLAADLLDKIGTTGSVVVWFKGFESSRTEEMAARHPQFAAGLRSINERIFDLRDVFSKGHYVHHDFHGSTSIKSVLSVMAPDLSYDGLAVPNGTTTMQSWAKLMSGELGEDEFDQIHSDLLEYCKLDTWAMVRIWQALLELK